MHAAAPILGTIRSFGLTRGGAIAKRLSRIVAAVMFAGVPPRRKRQATLGIARMPGLRSDWRMQTRDPFLDPAELPGEHAEVNETAGSPTPVPG